MRTYSIAIGITVYAAKFRTRQQLKIKYLNRPSRFICIKSRSSATLRIDSMTRRLVTPESSNRDIMSSGTTKTLNGAMALHLARIN